MEVGRGDGPPLFHFHGHGSSRLEVLLIAESAATLGVRLIGLDRPGIGRSEARPGYRILDWPADVADAADQLGAERFAVEGVSGGGVYAMAVAAKMPHRLTACGLISTVSPGAMMMKSGPWPLRVAWWMEAHVPGLFWAYSHLLRPAMGSDEASVEKYLVRFRGQLGPADQRLLDEPEFRKRLVQTFVESRRQGSDANLAEALVGVQPWGFEVGQIALEKMFLWHGEQDRVMPVAPARLLAQALPHCTATFYPDEGHFSTMTNHAQSILSTLTATGHAAQGGATEHG
jgi:pimeloyl-ACP methyl ester carboxylesterase